MPYIPSAPRRELDPLIDELARRLIQEADKLHHEAAFAGLLNYTCTSLALKIVQKRFGRLRYWLIALLTGTFQNIAQEFYRRLAGPYEDRQITSHGDLDLFQDLLKKS